MHGERHDAGLWVSVLVADIHIQSSSNPVWRECGLQTFGRDEINCVREIQLSWPLLRTMARVYVDIV